VFIFYRSTGVNTTAR